MRRLSEMKEEVKVWRDLEKEAESLWEVIAIAKGEGDTSLEEDLTAEVQKITTRLEDLEVNLLFSGEHDRRPAILAIHAGAGGTESQDWAEMLLRMYVRWAERHGRRVEMLDTSPGEEAGIKSVTLEIGGDYAYGHLKAEKGVHRLVRLSPYDASHLRHTSFALVEVLPEAEENVDVVVNPEDLRIEFYKSSGAGGQHVQKTSTAVRIVHIPTGIVATCQNERSQTQNKESAMKVLTARLMEVEMTKKAEEMAKLKGEHVSAGWGNQIRSYVLHPYKLVKDHRTGYETTSPDLVLDGEMDVFIKAYLKSMVGKS